jgi:hypothetical protein
MSRANASARQRRAGIEPSSIPSPISSSSPASQPAGLTLPQVISLVDTRLIKLEQFMKETLENKSNNSSNSVSNIEIRDSESNIIDSSDPNQLTDLNDILEEYNNRFVLLAEEMGQLKDIVLKLQTYTMDVNKMLIEERGLSDKNGSSYQMNTTDDILVEDVN